MSGLKPPTPEQAGLSASENQAHAHTSPRQSDEPPNEQEELQRLLKGRNYEDLSAEEQLQIMLEIEKRSSPPSV